VHPGGFMRVLVTGATGCIGTHVVDALRERGHEVLALVRRESDARELDKLGIEHAVSDLRNRTGTELALVQGHVDAVVHAAGSDSMNVNEMDKAEQSYVQNLLDGMHAARVSRLVLMSSIAVNGTLARRENPVDESTPVFRKRLRLHPFVRAKARIEDSVFAAQKAERLLATVLRVGVVFGRADRRTRASCASRVGCPGRVRIAWL
jgi:nucleoside-diphosphate-sugar epimerase